MGMGLGMWEILLIFLVCLFFLRLVSVLVLGVVIAISVFIGVALIRVLVAGGIWSKRPNRLKSLGYH